VAIKGQHPDVAVVLATQPAQNPACLNHSKTGVHHGNSQFFSLAVLVFVR
jgi:hypothetical protein